MWQLCHDRELKVAWIGRRSNAMARTKEILSSPEKTKTNSIIPFHYNYNCPGMFIPVIFVMQGM